MCGHCDMEGHDYCGDKRDERIRHLERQVRELSFLVMELKTKSGCSCGGACKPKKKTTKRSKK